MQETGFSVKFWSSERFPMEITEILLSPVLDHWYTGNKIFDEFFHS